jgi:mRNA interferase MazF
MGYGVAEPHRQASWAEGRQLHPTWRTRVPVRVAKRHAEIAVDQIRTISKARLGKKLGALTLADASALRRLITEMYGD